MKEYLNKNKWQIWWSAVVGIVTAIILFQNHVIDPREQLAKITVQYDYSVKVEYGKPIKVAQIIDGDTIELINGEHLRYIGIDTPEKNDQRKPVQCYSYEATERNRQLTEGKEIIFYKDVSDHDIYGRWLGFVYLPDGTFINKKLVEEGFAFAYNYKPDVSKKDEFKAAEVLASTNGLGLWSHCKVTKLSSGRKQTNAIGP